MFHLYQGFDRQPQVGRAGARAEPRQDVDALHPGLPEQHGLVIVVGLAAVPRIHTQAAGLREARLIREQVIRKTKLFLPSFASLSKASLSAERAKENSAGSSSFLKNLVL